MSSPLENKRKKLQLFVFFLFFGLTTNSQDINTVLSDGLSLTYFIHSNKTDKVQELIQNAEFKPSPESTTEDYQTFYKSIGSEKEGLLCLAIDQRVPDQPRVAFYHVDIEGTQFVNDIRRRLDEHALFKYLEEKDMYFFFVPNAQEGSEGEGGGLGYISGIEVTDVAIWFYAPQLVEYQIPWEDKFQSLVTLF